MSTRKYSRTLEDQDAICTSKSEVSHRFIKEMDKLMEEFFTRPLDDDYPVIVLDGLELGKMTILAAMGINREGQKRVLGIIEGGSENSVVVKDLLHDLIERRLKPSRPRLYALDGSKALHKGVTEIFGKDSLIQRCQVHKKRNVSVNLHIKSNWVSQTVWALSKPQIEISSWDWLICEGSSQIEGEVRDDHPGNLGGQLCLKWLL